MAKGKQTCKILKEIRKQIAAENDIDLIIEECTYKGDCLGTCPKCEAEVRYLERELEKRQRLGKAAIFAGMTIGTAITAASCGPLISPPNGMMENSRDTIVASDTIRNDSVEKPVLLESDVLVPEPDTMKAEEKKTACIKDELLEIVGGIEDEDFVEPNRLNDTLVDYEFIEGEVVENISADIVEQMPEFPGGNEKMMEFISSNTQYPQEAKNKGVQGRVLVNFVVDTDGSVTDVDVMKGIGGGCDEEAVRVVKSMPKWQPGMQRGKAVRVQYLVPVNFKLD